MILIGLLAVTVTVSKSRYVWKHLDDNVTYHTDNSCTSRLDVTSSLAGNVSKKNQEAMCQGKFNSVTE
jgi:hypothetical protein